MATGVDGVQPEQLARQVKTGHLLAAVLRHRVGLDRARTHRVDGLERLAGAEQVFAAVHRAAALYYPVEQLQVAPLQADGQAQLKEAAILAGDLESGQVGGGTVPGHGRREKFS
jgi:hypothetical protein